MRAREGLIIKFNIKVDELYLVRCWFGSCACVLLCVDDDLDLAGKTRASFRVFGIGIFYFSSRRSNSSTPKHGVATAPQLSVIVIIIAPPASLSESLKMKKPGIARTREN